MNVREKSGHVTCTLFSNIAFISNRIDNIVFRTCRDMSNGFGCEKKKKRDRRRRQHFEMDARSAAAAAAAAAEAVTAARNAFWVQVRQHVS